MIYEEFKEMKKFKWIKTKKSPKEWNPVHTKDNCFKHLCTYRDQHQIYDTIQEKMLGSQRRIEIINFLITKEDLINTIVSTRKEKRIPMKVMTWLNQASHHLDIEENDIFWLNQWQAKSWRKLALNGIPLRSNIKCHIKIMLIDKKSFIFSSANLTETSLTRNIENGILIANMRDEIRIIQKFITAIWKDYADTEITSLPSHITSYSMPDDDSEFLRVQSRPTNRNQLEGLETETENFRFLFTAPGYNTLFSFLIELLEQAEEEILLLSYKVLNIQQIGLLEVLKRKITCGVKVRILVCKIIKKETKELTKQLKKFYLKLIEIGCEIVSIENNHAKGIVIDQKEVLIMTANIDNHLLPHKGSINMGVYFKNKEYSDQVKAFINHLFANKTNTLSIK